MHHGRIKSEKQYLIQLLKWFVDPISPIQLETAKDKREKKET